MDSLKRTLNLPNLLEKKSFFLLGPRAVGKTTLIREQLPNATVFDLLDGTTFSELIRNPGILGEVATRSNQIIVIDEIQKLPSLLDQVHKLIESKKLRFLLTGSSARKLKRGSANLLGGRAWQTNLLPLTWKEIPNFDLLRFLNQGGLPHIYLSDEYKEELREYVSLYLREEIQAEATVRSLEGFTRFLDTIALCNGTEINFQSIASDSGVAPRTIDNYLSILEDTLIGFRLPPFLKTKKRKAITRSKFYLFDIGVTGFLCQRGQVLPKSELFGNCFEHFLLCEIRAFLTYTRSFDSMTYWRSTSQFEVDCIVGQCAIEIKSTDLVSNKHLKGLRAFKEEGLAKRLIVISCDRRFRTTDDGIEIWPWQKFLDALWKNTILA